MTSFPSKLRNLAEKSQPLDRAAITLMLVLGVLILGVVLSGDRTIPRVREFSWANRQVGAEDRAFLLTFNRPMDREGVERNLRIDPPLPGKISWAGKRMAYTLLDPVPYGTPFSVQLQGVTDQLYENQEGQLIEPFTGYFRSRDRAFVYIGVEGDQEGRLMLVNLSQDPTPVALTPENLTVIQFEPYPRGDRILFLAIERGDRSSGQFDPQLYTVMTGINPESIGQGSSAPQHRGQLETILDNKYYSNLRFDLSGDGKVIVVQRVNKKNPVDASPWVIREGRSPRPLQTQGGNFMIAPDSKSLLISQGPDLTSILPLEPNAEVLEYLPKFGQVLGFAADGSAAGLLKFNSDGTRSLFVVDTVGNERELYRTAEFGNILSIEFDPSQTIIYALITELMEDNEEYTEQPYIVAIDLKTEEIFPLVILPNQQQINLSLSPDGLALLFDQTVTRIMDEEIENRPRTDGGDTITTSRLWLLPLVTDSSPDANVSQWKPEELPFLGFNPRWLP
ncbi:hypothetical protein [Arthrospira platensis]|uniref:hypothetical protein n=1 Tax=Limnospira TaxID=2596745 RepID=UPI0001C389E7|nr:hypothetical protein [Arthrospira platensis]AMW31024.1 hypothetical protein AP285_26965 [Arthrospira platensis YZ]KDR54799.1 hypothetical protein APPUASWS_026740 [Arthrospira platensis str. Paraca]MBD2670537.1 hypothetical protein [Arthrospira platensis FACHB-439]MBD2711370.1 hypothetical protein [Arthrospira platensis FACHB-835]MDF2208405.1 hypothetical protein [Arthrospira platensis NCB002]MDT9295885.1 hypothetical protein [Arthrospira platensis PCC 7345]MDT9311542.1 hypothetical protei